MADQAVRELVQVEVLLELVRKEIRGESSSWVMLCIGPVILSRCSPARIARFKH